MPSINHNIIECILGAAAIMTLIGISIAWGRSDRRYRKTMRRLSSGSIEARYKKWKDSNANQ